MSEAPRNPAPDLTTRLAEHRTALADVRSHLANERTHLAYLRTGLSLMGFGITLNRFSLYFVQPGQLAPGRGHLLRDSETAGLCMVVLGVALLVWALLRYRRVDRQIREAGFEPSTTSVSAVTAGVIALGVIGALWLLAS